MMKVYLQRRNQLNPLLTKLVQLSLLSSAVFCAVSRLLDHRHHPVDVVGGSILGSVLGVMSANNVISHIVDKQTKLL